FTHRSSTPITMSTPIFAKTHNLLAYLEKPIESEGFEHIIDFLNESTVKYALTVNPTIHTSCIKKFWTSAEDKEVNDDVQIQTLVDGKRVNIKESSIRCILRLDDAEGTSCLTNAEIFEGLVRMGYEKPSDKLTFYKAFFSPQWEFLIYTILQCLIAKTTSWNEFNSTMASAIICLATNQKFNFSRYILLSLVKNIEAGVPFFMFPRFVQLIINHQVGDMTHHKDIFATPSLTKKVFTNIKRVGTRFSGEVTPLFDNMLVQALEEVAEHNVPLPLPSRDLLSGGEDSLKLKELMNLCTSLSNKVLDLESEVLDIKSTYKEKIEKLESRVERLKEENREELLKFKLLNVWTLVDLPPGNRVIGTRWVCRNKRYQRGIVVRNKSRLVAQGHRQEEGIDYDEFFAPVARIEAIRLFLAYASFMDFTVYQMNVKSGFLYRTIKEEVYVSQPLGFVDLAFPDRVYKVEKALYGLHQAPRAWYETLSTYLLDKGFRRGTTDKTLFIKKIKDDILLVQVYVDDIFFGFTKRSLSTEFEQLMHKRFQMSPIGELTFFLGLQVKQRKGGIFLSQDEYVSDILKEFGFSSVKSISTPMETHKPLSKDANGTDVDVHLYRSMIGSLMYLTSSRPYIMFAMCACSKFQVQPKVSHMHWDKYEVVRSCEIVGVYGSGLSEEGCR
nr:copia protein [Tanacetum cinerariifolium]